MKKDKEWLIREFKKIPHEFQDGYLKAKAIYVLPLIDQLDESEKVIIPQFVADEFDYNKNPYWEVDEARMVAHILRCAFGDEAKPSEFLDWVRENPEDYVMAVKNGYEIEREKLYYVKLPNTNSESEHLYLAQGNLTRDCWFNSRLERLDYEADVCKHKFTEQEIKLIDPRYWQFAESVEATPWAITNQD